MFQCKRFLLYVLAVHGHTNTVYGTTNTVYGATDTDARVGIGLLKGGFKQIDKKGHELAGKAIN